MTASVLLDRYRAFLAAKVRLARSDGLEVDPADIHPALMAHQRIIVQWAVKGGRRAIFAAFGLGKTLIQLETLRILTARVGGRALIVAPLGVRQEFRRDAQLIGIDIRFIRRIEEAGETGIYLTNYETVRDGKLDPNHFTAVSLDEASCLRGFGGTKTFREFMRLFPGVRHRFVATATPSPNQFIELLAYSAFLDVMDVGEAKTRFFKRNPEEADALTIHPHKRREFWLWCASWALFIQAPSDLGCSDDGYELPPMTVTWHKVQSDHSKAGAERDGQARMFRNAAIGVSDAAREKRATLAARIAKMLELRAEDHGAHRLIWHDLEAERAAIEKALPNAVSVYGAQDLDERERAIIEFSDGTVKELAAKPVLAGSGCNFQRHCSWAMFLGIGFKFNDFIQAVHRIQRFLQAKPVRIDIIYSEAEHEIRHALEAKWARHNEMVGQMTSIIREFGLCEAAMAATLTRAIGVERREAGGDGWRMILNDCVEETLSMPGASVDLILSSIPFSTQYEYTPSYNDFGHSDDNEHFWRQMDFLIPECLRVLKPGRIAAIHVKDRIVPSGLTGLGFQTLYEFHADAIAHFKRAGFALLGMKTIVTDVVRENNQTYRLGWTEQCKDGSRMGCGVPEYLLLFRKPPSDRSNGYADTAVVKRKPLCDDRGEALPFDSRSNWKRPVPGTGYSRGRWQMDAHTFARSSGDRLLSSEEMRRLPHETLYKLWRQRSTDTVYNFESHVGVAEDLDRLGRLPATFMLLPPHSLHPDVWTDITRMRTLNGAQSAAGREMHLCPMQFDVADRVITQFSMPGETVFDPFAGLGTVPLRALGLGRRGLGVELSYGYWRDACAYLAAKEKELAVPTLFDLMASEASDRVEKLEAAE